MGQQQYRLSFAWPSGLELALLVALYVILVPSFAVLSGTAVYNTHRLLQVLLLLGAGLCLVSASRLRTEWLQTFATLPSMARIALVAIVGAGCLASAFAAFPKFGLLEVTHVFLLFVLLVAIATFYRLNPKVANSVLLWTVVLGVLLYCGRFFVDYLFSKLGLQYAFRGYIGAIWPNGEFLGFAHVRHFNQFQTWTLPLIVLPPLLLVRPSLLVRCAYSGIAMTWWMLLFATGGRGTLLAMGVAVVVVAVAFHKYAWPWLKAQGVALVGGALGYVLLFKMAASASSATVLERSLTDDSFRFLLWERAWELVQANPLLGVGPMHYAQPSSSWAAHPHNAVLQWAAEWGLPATILAVGLVLWGLYTCLVRFRKESPAPEQHVRIALLATLVAATVHALVSGILVMPVSQVLLVLVVGWAWGLCITAQPARQQKPTLRSKWVLAGCTAIALCLMTVSVVPDAFVLAEKQAAYEEATHNPFMRPRFWLQGYITYEPAPTVVPALQHVLPPNEEAASSLRTLPDASVR